MSARLFVEENAYSVVKCSFQDNIYKPKSVTNVKLSVNILDSELISPIFHYQATVEYLIKDLVAKNIIDSIDREIEQLKDNLVDEGKEELADSEIIFEKMKRVENYTSDETESAKSNRYKYVAKTLMDRINGLRAEIDPESFDQLNIRENLKKIMDIENIRNRGYNTAINSITSILDTSKMGYQYIENLKNGRELVIREYEETDEKVLPDERYTILLKYFDNAQLIEQQKAYVTQMTAFEIEIEHLWDVLDRVYEDSKPFYKRITDFDDLAQIYKSKIKRNIKVKTGDPLYEDIDKSWDEISFIKPADTDVEVSNRTYVFEKDKVKKKIILMREKLQSMYNYKYPIRRRVMEDRLDSLNHDFNKFNYMINPYHIQPGLLLDVDITSIKRKKATLNGMANVLNEFLHGVSKGFQDAAFASFSRRRSTVRDDINMSFGSNDTEAGGEGTSEIGSSYLDMLNGPQDQVDASPEPVIEEAPVKVPKKRGGKKPAKKGLVDSGKKKRKTRAKSSSDGLTTL